MTTIIRTFEVSASTDKSYAAVSVPERWNRWASFVKQASSSGPKTHWIYDMGGMKVESDTIVTEAVENARYAFRQTKGFMKSGDTRLEIEPTERGSRIIWTTEYELPYSYLGKLADKLKARKQFEVAIDRSVANLEKLLSR